MPTSHIELWTQHIRRITNELENLLLHRQIYRRYGEMVAYHLYARQLRGKVVIVTDKPVPTLAAVRKQ